ncbi:MAG: RNA polymerase factor sigma-54 [Bacteroidales bacterium]|nr:RNA polymerase factor sigma-54 [Bacteroidales bacterium]MBR6273342.1 RNA polymerase factor sigma-54 [Bacteroidales bacterium]
MSDQRLTQVQRQELKLSPQQIQLMKLLQLPLIELEQRIKEEIESNPALEDNMSSDDNEPMNEGEENLGENDGYEEGDNGENDDYNDDEIRINKEDEFDLNDYLPEEDEYDYAYKSHVNNRSQDDEDRQMPITHEDSFQDYLIQQLGYHDLTEEEELIGKYIIGNLDDNGYLSRPIPNLVDDLLFTMNLETTEEEVKKVLKVVQQFDPPGIGATNLQECLLIQIERLQEENPYNDYRLCTDIIKNCFEEFTKKHYDKIAKRTGASNRQLKAALDEILKLNPKPGDSSNSSARNSYYITPDFFISIKDGHLELSLDGRNNPDLKVNKQYVKMLEDFSKSKESKTMQEAAQFVRQKIDGAKWFIDAIRQRQHTLYITMKAIMDMQEEYFLTGDETKLKPMILKDIAEKVNLDISTVSRVANSKYVQTPYGTHLLKTFFSEGITNEEGEEVSTREIKKILQDCVEEEDKNKPMTDEELMAVLKEKGYPIARRTVAKYREQLGIPVARLRKEL